MLTVFLSFALVLLSILVLSHDVSWYASDLDYYNHSSAHEREGMKVELTFWLMIYLSGSLICCIGNLLAYGLPAYCRWCDIVVKIFFVRLWAWCMCQSDLLLLTE
ncbi:hypothetical protein SASPL_130601 [Salvia splendens]|uniref:Uncharacterized protein n=1 Tax=Salvia splendens TaxID=180675 RepID=A0A8X8X6C1_SALSN|nr:hypothetical protein SASPL_130601 [Salvia splendens]